MNITETPKDTILRQAGCNPATIGGHRCPACGHHRVFAGECHYCGVTSPQSDPTPAQLLTAAREGEITATVIEAETLPPLAGGDGPAQYPVCTIALQIETIDLSSITSLPGVTYACPVEANAILPAGVRVEYSAYPAGLPGRIVDASTTAEDCSGDVRLAGVNIPTRQMTIRSVCAWKCVYYSTDGDTLNGGRGTYDFRAVHSDQATRGDVTVSVDDSDGDTLREIIFRVGAGMSPIPVIDVTDLTEEDAEEVREAIESAIDEAYSGWEPEHPSEDEIYAALVGKRRETTNIEAEAAGEEITVALYAGTHCGQPQYAYEGDESETVYEDSEDCAKAARERLEELLETAIEETEAMGEEEDDYGDYRIVADRVGKTVTIYSDDDKILENGDAMSDVGKAVRYAFGRSADTQGRGCSVDNDHGWQWDVTGHGMDIDGHEGALDQQERQAAEALEASLRNDE